MNEFSMYFLLLKNVHKIQNLRLSSQINEMRTVYY